MHCQMEIRVTEAGAYSWQIGVSEGVCRRVNG
jgi:hypothetical protein